MTFSVDIPSAYDEFNRASAVYPDDAIRVLWHLEAALWSAFIHELRAEIAVELGYSSGWVDAYDSALRDVEEAMQSEAEQKCAAQSSRDRWKRYAKAMRSSLSVAIASERRAQEAAALLAREHSEMRARLDSAEALILQFASAHDESSESLVFVTALRGLLDYGRALIAKETP